MDGYFVGWMGIFWGWNGVGGCGDGKSGGGFCRGVADGLGWRKRLMGRGLGVDGKGFRGVREWGG